MSLSLYESNMLQQIAKHLYSFLPGKPHPYADQRISFAGIAYELGLGEFWVGGSKLPAISTLLERALEKRQEAFCALILEVVKRGIKYRENKEQPITREEIKMLNELILKIGFKIPELWDTKFLESLPSQVKSNKQENQKINEQKRKDLHEKLLKIAELPPQERGYAFERFLNEIFEAFSLNPQSPFRLQGEQIDGSLELDGETYLIEARWRNVPSNLQDLLTFHGRIAGKATWTRGIFISYNGFREEALTAFSRGRPTNLITLTGQDLHFILAEDQGVYLDLDEAIRIKVRYAAETGNIGVSVYELLSRRKQHV